MFQRDGTNLFIDVMWVCRIVYEKLGKKKTNGCLDKYLQVVEAQIWTWSKRNDFLKVEVIP